VRTFPVAAWNRGGTVAYRQPGIEGWTSDRKARPQAQCVDLAELILERPVLHQIVLKLDCEGAEYTLLEHLIETGADRRLELAIVEWHGVKRARRLSLERRLGCELQEWEGGAA
jgi:FkbM family methyltransferase